MALTPADKQRRYRERVRKQETQESLNTTEPFKEPFFEFWGYGADWSAFELPLALAGIVAPDFKDDRGPKDFVLPHATDGLTAPFDPNDPFDRRSVVSGQGSLGRAEVMIDCLLDAAVALSGAVQSYKTREIMKRLAEIEASDLSDTEAKKSALKEAARLQKMLDQLEKQVRWTFPQWKVTG
ncbi:hypothetical protein [Cypionkella psychrotolerans]|uniref:hypothetical protein n=1 Tax=Cypionkella psychrotolerans TaxID=1678131 RepID=UPI0006B497B9|nr:hypothetical protein [Cypionkella psychrotolerans]